MYSANMSKVVTIRLGEEPCRRTKAAAQADNRPISNFMETAALRFLEQVEFVDEREMAEIRADKKLLKNLRAGSTDIKKGRYKVVRDR
jgi:predicted transcriptional regulator